MAKLMPAETKLEDLDRAGLLWLVGRACPSHWLICEAMEHQLMAEADEAFKSYLAFGDAEFRLFEEAQKAFAGANTTERLSQRARDARWTAYENKRAEARRAGARKDAAWRRHTRAEARAELYRVHLNSLSLMVAP
ncbi:MAG: hypothetical protein ACT7A5_15950 [Ferrovibrionaceae bacterium]